MAAAHGMLQHRIPMPRCVYTHFMRRMLLTIATFACAWACAVTDLAMAQVAAQPPLKPIDHSVADVNELAASLRDFSVDLRLPLGFQQVYEMPHQPGMLMRMSGAVYAVFPNSTYARTPVGPLATIPPGTVFYIGLPPATNQEELEDAPWPGAVDLHRSRVHHRTQNGRIERHINRTVNDSTLTSAASGTSASEGDSPSLARSGQDTTSDLPQPTLITDEQYRARRVAELLQRAAQALAQRQHARGTPVMVDDTDNE